MVQQKKRFRTESVIVYNMSMNVSSQIIKLLVENGFRHIETLFYYAESHIMWSDFYSNENVAIIVDFNICDKQKSIFNYELYTQKQNDYVFSHDLCLRFNCTDLESFKSRFERLMERGHLIEFSDDQVMQFGDIHTDSTALEFDFEKRFEEVYGIDALSYLQRELPLSDVNGRQTFIDFALSTENGMIAVEENGVAYHHPQLIGTEAYQKQLDKQNALSLFGYRIYRFSSMDIRNSEKMNSNILRFFGPKEQFRPSSGFLVTRDVQLYDHQKEALSQIRADRQLRKRVSLIVFPTAAGKSKIIETDIAELLLSNPNLRICIVAPTTAVVDDWQLRMSQLIKRIGGSIRIGRSLSDQIIISTYHLLWSNTYAIEPTFFDYLVIDEAHHVTAPLLKRALKFFTPTYLMGLTATPKEDKESFEFKEIFGEYETQLTIEEAMDRGVISPVRAFRVESNLDLSEVRFNGRNYINADLEKVIRVQSRNELIADVIQEHFSGPGFDSTQGIIFCTSIAHADEMAHILNDNGITALAAHSKLDNDAVRIFRESGVRFLTTCSMISEGWDCPQIGIVVMARPTLSKVLYLQQLGRGFRKHPGKECLFVIDVVDQYGSLAIPWNINSIFNNPYYVPFGDPRAHYKPGDLIIINGIKEIAVAIKEISTLTFEQLYGDLLSAEQAARSLFISTGTLITWIQTKKIESDLVIPFGRSKLHFFKPESIEGIREKFELGIHNDDTIYEDFFAFIQENVFTFSFKIIFLLALFKKADVNGEAVIDGVRGLYIRFYLERFDLDIKVDRDGCVYTREYLSNDKLITTSILSNPFEKFERKRFVFYNKDLSKISINTSLWSRLSNNDLSNIQSIMFQHLENYYRDLDGLQNVDYLRRNYEL